MRVFEHRRFTYLFKKGLKFLFSSNPSITLTGLLPSWFTDRSHIPFVLDSRFNTTARRRWFLRSQWIHRLSTLSRIELYRRTLPLVIEFLNCLAMFSRSPSPVTTAQRRRLHLRVFPIAPLRSKIIAVEKTRRWNHDTRSLKAKHHSIRSDVCDRLSPVVWGYAKFSNLVLLENRAQLPKTSDRPTFGNLPLKLLLKILVEKWYAPLNELSMNIKEKKRWLQKQGQKERNKSIPLTATRFLKMLISEEEDHRREGRDDAWPAKPDHASSQLIKQSQTTTRKFSS